MQEFLIFLQKYFVDTIVGVSWIFSSSVQSVATNPYHTFSSAGAHEVKLVVVSDKGCSDSLTTIIDVNALPDASIFAYPSNKVCAGDSIELSAYAGYDNYYWSNEDSLSKTMVASSGTYDVLIITNNNCMSKGIIEVEVLDDFVLNVSPDTTISLGDEIEIFAEGASNYQWSPPWTLDDPYISSPVAKPWSTKQYQVIGVDDNGCADTANITVAVNRDYQIEPYNLITPNGDGKNDIIEFDGTDWIVAFKSSESHDVEVVTNNYTSKQLKWDGDKWFSSYEGVYNGGFWRLYP